jgi:hypothetical protein
MNDETARVLLQADVEQLVAAAQRLNQRIRTAATTYLGICVSFGTVVVAIANLIADRDDLDLKALFETNRNFLGVAGCFLYGIGLLQLLSFARDRKHYVKILTALNDIRQQSSETLGIGGQYASLWTSSQISAWPGDSVTTMTFVALTISTICILTAALAAMSLPLAAIILLVGIGSIAQTYFAITVSE